MIDINQVPSPCYVMDETLLRKNLTLIKKVADKAGVEIILAFKSFAMWKSFPIFREYIRYTTASSLYEARLAYEEFGSKAHTYSPAYTEADFPVIMKCSSHITFNSFTQFQRFYPMVEANEEKISCGIRINPEYSEVEVELYNPCAPGTRFGVTADLLPDTLPTGIEGFHCHCHCESSSYDLENTLKHIEEKFSRWFPQIKWLNLGGGHLMTRKDYDTEHLISLLKGLKSRYPHLEIILEPGSAFTWQTGPLVASVVDIVESRGIKTAILDVSFTCHMPDCLEMPYQPTVRGAETLSAEAVATAKEDENIYRLGGNSCLSGDYMGSWRFDHPLQIGERIVLEDMIHYTMVKTNMFNGIHHPSIAIWHTDNTLEVYKTFRYEDYRDRMA
ncbi:MAG: carboxynorspermidine decarboxylase [Bacteroides sp.]|nr:carboxynorspermidine decarboxylase [Bacteroides sp.]